MIVSPFPFIVVNYLALINLSQMEFKTRTGVFFLLQILLIIASLSLASLNLFAPVFKTGFLRYNYIAYYLLGITWLLRIYRQIYSSIVGKPILKVNENYLYDLNNDITYDWKDVDSVDIKRSFLIINLKQPSVYLDKIGNSFRRFLIKLLFRPNTKSALFFIDLDIVEAEKSELVGIINDYRNQRIHIE